jgi:uncharacterized protein YjdB
VVSVRERRSANVTLRPQTVLIEAGGTISLQADVLDRSGDPLATPVVWSTDDATVALVAQDGTVTAVARGTTTITADADGMKAKADIEVQQAAVQELSITQAPPAIHVGDDIVFEVLVADSQGATLDRPVTWHSDQPKVVAIRDGRPIAVATGSATLQAECAGRTADIAVTVDPAEVASIVIAGLPDAPRAGGRFPLQAVLLHHTGKPLIREVTWSSSDPAIASVSDAGVLRVHAEGAVDVTAHCEAISESAALRCTAAEAAPDTALQTAALREAVASTASTVAAAGRAEAPHGAGRRWSPWLGAAALIVVGLGLAQVLGPRADTTDDTTVEEPATAPREAESNTQAPDGADRTPGPEQAVDAAATDPAEPPTTEVAGGEPAPAESTETGPAGAETQPPPTQGAAAQPPASAVDLTAVTAVRIEGGDRIFEAGARETLTGTPLNADGGALEASPLRWRSSDAAVVTVRDGDVRAVGPGQATITASVSGIEGSIEVTVERPALEAPTREETLAMLQRFVMALRNGDTVAITRLFGRAGGRAGARADADEVLARMRETNFTARITRMGDPQLTPNGAAVDFDTELVWRNAQGAREVRTIALFAVMQPSPDGWRLAGVRRRPTQGG